MGSTAPIDADMAIWQALRDAFRLIVDERGAYPRELRLAPHTYRAYVAEVLKHARLRSSNPDPAIEAGDVVCFCGVVVKAAEDVPPATLVAVYPAATGLPPGVRQPPGVGV